MALRHAVLNSIKIGAYVALVGTLIAVTLASIVAASGTAQVSLTVQYQGPRELDLSACEGTADALSACPIKVQILHPEEVFGYGYTTGYAYRFLEWVSKGYGYASYSTAVEHTDDTVTFSFTGLPVDSYVFRAYLDLTGEGGITEDLEPLAFAEESPGDTVFEIALSEDKSGIVVIGESGASIHGVVSLLDSASPAGTQVVAHGAFGDAYVTTAAADGSFVFEDVPAGLWYSLPYSISASREGYHPAGTAVLLPAEGATIESPLALAPMHVTAPIPLDAGWSMVSLPVSAPGLTVGSTFGIGTPVYAWEGTGYRLLENADALQPGTGYWVYSGTARVANATGAPFLPDALTLSGAGWHLVGGPAYLAEVPSTTPGIALPLYTWQATHYEESSTLEPTVGYWLLVTAETATVPVPEEGSS